MDIKINMAPKSECRNFVCYNVWLKGHHLGKVVGNPFHNYFRVRSYTPAIDCGKIEFALSARELKTSYIVLQLGCREIKKDETI